MAGTSGDVVRTGGQLLVDTLRAHGCDAVFCVPGESFLPVLDALHDVQRETRLYVCRHEGAAANMAEAYGKLTGRPGVHDALRRPAARAGGTVAVSALAPAARSGRRRMRT